MKKSAGAAIIAGSVFPAGKAASANSDSNNSSDDIPDPERQVDDGADDDWWSFNGNAGNTRFVEDGPEFDGDALEVAWSAEYSGTVAVSDGVVYTSGSESVVALDANDGSVLWEKTETELSGPTVAHDTVFLADDEVVALDTADGSVRWETSFDLENEPPNFTVTVAYDAVYVVVDDTLYALEVDDGSIRWERTEGDDGAYVTSTVAAANGVVYVALDGSGVLALDPSTGDEVWTADDTSIRSEVRANARIVSDQIAHNDFVGVYDAQSGDPDAELLGGGDELMGYNSRVAMSEEVYVVGHDYALVARDLESGEELFSVDAGGHKVTAPTISDETVYVYFEGESDTGGYSGELVAFDLEGTEQWSLESDDTPVGIISAISDETLFVSHDGELVALREEDDEEDEDEEPDDEEEEEEEADASLSVSVSNPERIPLEGNETFDVTVENASETRTSASVTVEVGRVCRAIGTEVPAEGSKTVRIGVYGGDIDREGEVDWEVIANGERETGTVTVD